MSGPPPGHGAAHPSTRARRNKATTGATLDVLAPEDRAAIEVPELPADRLWDPKTSDFWRDAWQSPMRLEWDAGDLHLLLVVAYLVDEFYQIVEDRDMAQWRKINAMARLAGQMTSTGARLGLDPYARRSLQWLLVKTEEAEANTAATKSKTAARKKAAAKKPPKRGGLDALK